MGEISSRGAQMCNKSKLILPYPVSVNRYYRCSGRSIHRSKDANDYRDAVQWLAKCEQIKSHDGDFALILVLHPRSNKNGSASGTVIDLDNALKVTLDALEGVIYNNDKQIKEINIKYGDPVTGGALTVIAKRMEA